MAEFITEAFKSVAVIVNKWDAVEDKDSNTINVHTDEARQRMKFFDYVPVLFISAKTVEHHVARIRRRLGAESRSEMLSMLRAMLGSAG